VTDPDPDDLKIATRRVESAIYAFGGYVHRPCPSDKASNGSAAAPSSTRSSIFRRLPLTRGAAPQPSDGPYQLKFHQRYFIKGNGISWEVEENPPIDVTEGNSSDANKPSQKKNSPPVKDEPPSSDDEQDDGDDMETSDEAPPSPSGDSPESDTEDAPTADRSQKMKYRCKLCGQPKQNHCCPYRRKLQRSIGISVLSAVNGYTAEEPGDLAPALSEMNNFVSYAGTCTENAIEIDDDATTYQTNGKKAPPPAQVTPTEGGSTNRGVHDSPQNSSLSSAPTPGRPASSSQRRVARKKTPKSTSRRGQKRPNHAAGGTTPPRGVPKIFAEPLILRPEHYRAVSRPKKNRARGGNNTAELDQPEAFEYPPIPVSFHSRKQMSDTLFYLSRSIPSITGEVAPLLQTAREREEWDLAVAELLTQVVVALYCVEGDHQLEGLRRYLLNLGVST
jgi:hypothetical protein